jgi:hypothetical protein
MNRQDRKGTGGSIQPVTKLSGKIEIHAGQFFQTYLTASVFNDLSSYISRGQSIAAVARYCNASSHHVFLSKMRLPVVSTVHFADPQGFHPQIIGLPTATVLYLQGQVLPVSAGHFENHYQHGECAGRAQGTQTTPWGSVAALESSGPCDLYTLRCRRGSVS